MVMLIIKFYNIAAISDGYGPALVERLAAPPSGPSSPTDVVSHESVGTYHQHISSILLRECCLTLAWKEY